MQARIYLIWMFCFMWMNVSSQSPTQNIRGRVLDADTHTPLPGVNVYIVYSNPLIGTTTDASGYYILKNVPVGRYTINFRFIGYEQALFKEISVGSGKETELNVKLKENFRQLDEVVVKPGFRKDKAQNNMATLSARSFSVEEATRYAGGWNDPSRLAGSFAGVTMAEGVNDNAIVIRGNSPKGILWQLEGVEIPAPNHLNGVNNGGGIETIFSVNMLANSDFFTGAFPAEYGNAMSGTFNMKFRNGNSDHWESAFQIGSQGVDISSEGPLSSKKKASYLFNYRYSTMALAGLLVGNDFGMPEYQDLSFKFHLPTTNSGTFNIWGIGGLSSVTFEPEENPDDWSNTFDNNQYDTGSDVGAAGISHNLHIGKRNYLKSSLATTHTRFSMNSDQLLRKGEIIPLADHKENNTRLIFNTDLNTKISNRLTNKAGISLTFQNYNLNIRGNSNPGINKTLDLISDQSGKVMQSRIFDQFKWRISPKIDLNAGISISHFEMNNEWIPEPRAGMSWRFLPRHSVHIAYGKHSRPEPVRFYLAEDDNGRLLNSDLRVTKANHYVLAYDFRINENMKLKIEPYYQELYDVPVIYGSSESLINYTWDMYFDEPLMNNGTGRNKGVDITLERYMKDGFYYMFTGTLFDSKYKGGDGKEYHTSFNRNFVFNLLGGKEWKIKDKNTFGLNGKIAFMGGNRFTPPNQEQSAIHEMVIEDKSRAFEWQENNKLFLDIALKYQINQNKKAHIITIQAKNALMQSEMFGWAYDFEKQKVVEHGITMVYPYFSYKLLW
ncbi:TonB-dependent receptor [Marinilabilia rubra]|uniref:TonB-dependent receptor n=1 Tax=Marinilabilia rubra TaxID=2162893 RepID=A0A2U2BC37_9BACT|nr:TonB-dependent receptor [Marinilabilia rubra]PWE00621.1 TonB-dependent receptor [Marinilabilia rubra]